MMGKGRADQLQAGDCTFLNARGDTQCNATVRNSIHMAQLRTIYGKCAKPLNTIYTVWRWDLRVSLASCQPLMSRDPPSSLSLPPIYPPCFHLRVSFLALFVS